MSEYILDNKGVWNREIPVFDDEGNEGFQYEPVLITDVSVTCLLQEWESLVSELSDKEFDLACKKEQYAKEEFEIVYQSDINFKELYGSTSEKVRKQHAKTVLVKLDGEIQSLELSINWIKQYIPLLKEVVRCKQ